MALFAARHFKLKDILEGCLVNNEELLENEKMKNTTNGDESSRRTTKNRSIPIEVVAIPCVGDEYNLLQQMESLDRVSGGHGVFPTILRVSKYSRNSRNSDSNSNSNNNNNSNNNSKSFDNIDTHDSTNDNNNSRERSESNSKKDIATGKDRVFGNPYADHYRIYSELKEGMGIEFDLIYTPRAMEMLLDSFAWDREMWGVEGDNGMWEGHNILWYHCGGLEGNESQRGRYRYNGLL